MRFRNQRKFSAPLRHTMQLGPVRPNGTRWFENCDEFFYRARGRRHRGVNTIRIKKVIVWQTADGFDMTALPGVEEAVWTVA